MPLATLPTVVVDAGCDWDPIYGPFAAGNAAINWAGWTVSLAWGTSSTSPATLTSADGGLVLATTNGESFIEAHYSAADVSTWAWRRLQYRITGVDPAGTVWDLSEATATRPWRFA